MAKIFTITATEDEIRKFNEQIQSLLVFANHAQAMLSGDKIGLTKDEVQDGIAYAACKVSVSWYNLRHNRIYAEETTTGKAGC